MESHTEQAALVGGTVGMGIQPRTDVDELARGGHVGGVVEYAHRPGLQNHVPPGVVSGFMKKRDGLIHGLGWQVREHSLNPKTLRWCRARQTGGIRRP